MTVATIITQGYGSYSTVNFVPTIGYGDYGGSPTPTPTPSPSDYIVRCRRRGSR